MSHQSVNEVDVSIEQLNYVALSGEPKLGTEFKSEAAFSEIDQAFDYAFMRTLEHGAKPMHVYSRPHGRTLATFWPNEEM